MQCVLYAYPRVTRDAVARRRSISACVAAARGGLAAKIDPIPRQLRHLRQACRGATGPAAPPRPPAPGRRARWPTTRSSQQDMTPHLARCGPPPVLVGGLRPGHPGSARRPRRGWPHGGRVGVHPGGTSRRLMSAMIRASRCRCGTLMTRTGRCSRTAGGGTPPRHRATASPGVSCHYPGTRPSRACPARAAWGTPRA